jgi:hypothetical protein
VAARPAAPLWPHIHRAEHGSSGIPEEDRATWEDQEVQQLADALRPWREKHPQVPVLEDVVLLMRTQALLHFSTGAALVVVGRKHGADRGEMVRSLLNKAACPVAVVPSWARALRVQMCVSSSAT